MAIWNPWHGCQKYSSGCQNCYVYRRDESIGKDASDVFKTKNFRLPLAKKKNGEYKIPSGTIVYTSMTSDFFLEEADEWRNEVWDVIRTRKDLNFMIITKRIVRAKECLPDDWQDGYDNVAIACTVENQIEADIRLPIFLAMPIKHKYIVNEPLLSKINLEKYLNSSIISVVVGGESGSKARVCDYEWILDIKRQCQNKNVGFYFKQTGAKFLKNGKLYRVKRIFQHSQAKKANINTVSNLLMEK